MAGLMIRRVAGTAAVLVLLSAFGPALSPAEAADLGEFSGSVRDNLGNLLEDVEVLVIASTSRIDPDASTRSDLQGRFRIANLAPGRYRLIALKKGYSTFIASVNTRAQSWIDVILHPAPRSGEERPPSMPKDASWALRLPETSILRDIDPASAEQAEDEAPERLALSDYLQLRVDQLFALQVIPSGEGDRQPHMTGRETRLVLASALGERGQMELQAAQEGYDSAYYGSEEATSASRGASVVGMDLSYDIGPENEIALSAFHSRHDMSYAPLSEGSATPPASHERKTWGYDAGWSRQLDDLSNLDLEIDYRESSLRIAEGEPEVGERSMGASGSYVTLTAPRHQVEVDFQARMLDSPEAASLALAESSSRLSYGLSGLCVGVEARDNWFITGPFTLLYGLGYKHASTSTESSVIVPRLGGTWSAERLVLSFLVSYHHLAAWGEAEDSPSERTFRPAGRLGYEAAVELPLALGFRLTGSSSYSPIDLTFPDYPAGDLRPSSSSVYLTDGNAAVDRRAVAIVREGGGSRIYLELVGGEVEGRIAPTLPMQLPIRLLYDGRLRFTTGRMGLLIPASGTDLRLDYRRLVGWSAEAERQAPDSVQRSLELHVAQDLMRARALGNWRFLAALRVASLEGGYDEEVVLAGNRTLLDSQNHQLSAGLSVMF
jgi:hypothetical protein